MAERSPPEDEGGEERPALKKKKRDEDQEVTDDDENGNNEEEEDDQESDSLQKMVEEDNPEVEPIVQRSFRLAVTVIRSEVQGTTSDSRSSSAGMFDQ